MKLYDIENINNFHVGDEMIINMKNNEKSKTKKLKIKQFCGKGGYGKVYKCELNNENYVIKLSTNENPIYLKKCYKYLKKDLKEFIVDIFYSGKLLNNEEYQYYNIMNYGGNDLKNYDFDDKMNFNNSLFIIKQLFLLSKKICKTKKMIMDFKMSNILFNKQHKITITDIYFQSNNYEKLENCKIYRTHAVLDINVTKEHKNNDYNYTYIYVLLIFMFINIFCVYDLNTICEKIQKKLNINIENKKFTNIIQLAYYKKFKHNNVQLNEYLKNIKKNLKIKNFNNIYKLFTNYIIIKQLYSNILTKEEFVKILDDILIPIPNKRNIEKLKLFITEKIEI